jgi:hypothetical protein
LTFSDTRQLVVNNLPQIIDVSQLIAITIYRTAIDRKIIFSGIIFNLNKFDITLVTYMVKYVFVRLRLKMFKNVRNIKMKQIKL